MGCIARLGCLVLLVILACIGWFTRDRCGFRSASGRTAAAVSGRWQPATAAGAERDRAALARLSQPQRTGLRNAACWRPGIACRNRNHDSPRRLGR